jgi:catechol 2,3-dioxygenase-like lactoylglutathione lyase family enzyme
MLALHLWGITMFKRAIAVALLLTASAHAEDKPASTEAYATLERAAIMVQDRPATVKFYRDVLGYTEESSGTGIKLPPGHPLGLPPEATLSMSYMKSRDGAYVALMGVDDAGLAPIDRPKGKGNAYNDVFLVHVTNNVDEIHRRAVAGGYEVLSPPTLSRTGRAKQMLLRDPNGIKIEINQMIEPKK